MTFCKLLLPFFFWALVCGIGSQKEKATEWTDSTFARVSQAFGWWRKDSGGLASSTRSLSTDVTLERGEAKNTSPFSPLLCDRALHRALISILPFPITGLQRTLLLTAFVKSGVHGRICLLLFLFFLIKLLMLIRNGVWAHIPLDKHACTENHWRLSLHVSDNFGRSRWQYFLVLGYRFTTSGPLGWDSSEVAFTGPLAVNFNSQCHGCCVRGRGLFYFRNEKNRRSECRTTGLNIEPYLP